MSQSTTSGQVSRRDLLRAGALLPAGVFAANAQTLTTRTPPPYTLSINVEIMFRALKLSKADRIRAIAAQGFSAYSFWNAGEADRQAMLQAQKETGLTCVSLVGTGNAGSTTGFTRPGAQQALLAEIRDRAAIAREFGTPDLITFVGQIQDDVPWDVQRAGIVEGLKRAGDIAAEAGVTIAVEPVSVNPNQPRRALDRAADAFPVIADVDHPNVKVCFDFYHLQRTEGNLTINLRQGLANGWIKVIQIGDNPGRLEPGTGEINHPFLFAELRRLNYTGYLDTEMGTSSTPEYAMAVTRRMSEEF